MMQLTRELVIRVLLGILLFTGIYIFPYWFVIAAGAAIALFVPFYLEFVAVVIFEEILYHGAGSVPTEIWLPVILLSSFVVVEALRSHVRERILRT